MSNNDFTELIQKYSHAYLCQDWGELERIGEKLGVLIGIINTRDIRDIREVASIYLGSLIGSGTFLTSKDIGATKKYTQGLAKVEKYANENSQKFSTGLSPIIKSGYEIQLYLTSQQSDSRNKAAAALRKLARPDLAIHLTSQQLEITRLNYYSLVVRSAAYCDLSSFDKAISDGKKALKYSPLDKSHFCLVSLSRAYIERFKKTGDISDSESAFELAEKSFDLKPDEYSANIFLKVIHSIGLPGMENLISNLKNTKKTNHYELDQRAIEIAKEVLRSSTPILTAGILSTEDDFLTDELFEDWLNLESDDDFDNGGEEIEHAEDYFEDYFEDYVESLNDLQNPHLEP